MPGHDVYIKAMRSREPMGMGFRGRELARLYAREGRPGSYEDFTSKDPLAARWISERIDRMNETVKAQSVESALRIKLIEKATPDLPDNVSKPIRLELLMKSLQQDIANYINGDEPAHRNLRYQGSQDDNKAFADLANACRQEALRRQHELFFLLEDTIAEVKTERDSRNGWVDPATIADANERKKVEGARAQFDQAVADADAFLRGWSRMLQTEVKPDADYLKKLLDNKSLKALYDVSISLFSGLDHSRAPNTAYRLPAVVEAIGERLAVQGQARSDVAAYGLIAARLSEVPNRDPDPSPAVYFDRVEYQKKPGRAFGDLADLCLERNIANLDKDAPAASQALRNMYGPEGSARDVVGKLDKAANYIMQKEWPLNKNAYAAVADLTTSLRKMKDTIAAQFGDTKASVVQARTEAEGIIDAAVARLLALIATKAT